MFTTNNRRNRTAAIITIAAASVLVTSAGFAAPKRDVGRTHNREDMYIVTVGRPATPPNGTGDHDITTGAMRNRDLNLNPEPAAFSGSLVSIGTPAPFPTGRGHDITTSAMRNRDLSITPEPAANAGSFVRIGTPSPFPTGRGHNITAGAMRNRDLSLNPEPAANAGSFVRISTPSPFPPGRGHDITAGAMRNRDLNITPEPAANTGSFVGITTPSPFPTGRGHDITASALTANGSTSPRIGSAGSPAASAPSRGFLQSLDMTSSVRYVGTSTAAASARNPFADGRAWASVDRDGQNGLVATAGWSFLLK